MNPLCLIIVVALLVSEGCGTRTKAQAVRAAEQDAQPEPPATVPQPEDVQDGVCDVPATGIDIVVEGPFDAVEILGKVRLGMSPGEVVEILGSPKEVRCEEEPHKWFFTYEFPHKQGNDRWMILMVEYEDEKVSFAAWLPSG